MENKTSISHTITWKKKDYPLLTKHYRKLTKKFGKFPEFLCQLAEAHLRREDEISLSDILDAIEELKRSGVSVSETNEDNPTISVTEKRRMNAILKDWAKR